MSSVFSNKIEFLKGVGPQRAQILNKELNIFTYGDLLQHYPFRYDDRSAFTPISTIRSDEVAVQVKGRIRMSEIVPGTKKRLVAYLYDGTEVMELVWFQGIKFVQPKLKPNIEYVVFGKPNVFKGKVSIVHPELEFFTPEMEENQTFRPVYNTTELMKKKYIDSKMLSKMMAQLFSVIFTHIPETLPPSILKEYRFISKANALKQIHFPENTKFLNQAKARLKFEELFYVQLKILKERNNKIKAYKGFVFEQIPLVTEFYKNHLPFDLTGAQKRVIKEIRKDFMSGQQMNRLLQGDVGSGKTIVAFICMLMSIDNGHQAALMAPTEILAEQHYQGLKAFADTLGITIKLLSGSTKTSARKEILPALEDGSLQVIVGTHALLEDKVQFKSLGLCVIDEQHRFGVAQRAKMWKKNTTNPPHVLVMTATPIPRTLAMTLYGDLHLSVIDELPPGRKPIVTTHRYDESRLAVFGFLKKELAKGRQAYIVYPLIEESQKSDLKDLMDGYESVARAFPKAQISIVHGKMKAADKEYEMQRFVKGETHIMVATTVIEVGVNVPNASIMVIENAERFGLAQLHQLRGRVGRGAEQSYCVLMTKYELSKDARTRMETMVRTNDGFEIADVDLKLRGPGDLSGTQQSGVLDLLLADLSKDAKILEHAREKANAILTEDVNLQKPENAVIRKHIESLPKSSVNWGRIS